MKNILNTVLIITTITLLLYIFIGGNEKPGDELGAYVGSTLDITIDTSDATALADGESWTTGWIDRNGYAGIKVAFMTDQDGYFTIAYSPDASNTDSSLTRYYRTSDIEPPHKFENMREYVKVTFYNNSGSNQTYLRPDISLTNSGNMLNIPVDAVMSRDYDAISVRPTDYDTECALGRRQECTTWNKFGYNEDIDTTTDPEIIASWGGTYQYLTTGEPLLFTSTDSNDTLTGTGAQQVVIYGVDENWDTAIEVLPLNGTGVATTAISYIGINRFAIYKASTSEMNVGTITATAETSGYTLAQMPAGQGTTQQCVYFVPRNHQFDASWLYINALREGPSTAPIVTFKGLVYSSLSTAEFEVFRASINTGVRTESILDPGEPFIIGEKSILWFTAETTQNDTSVRCRFSGKLIKDPDA